MKKLVFSWTLLILFSACIDKLDDPINAINCTGVACTEIFVTLSVSVSDSDGVKVPLDSIMVTKLDDNADLTRDLSTAALVDAREFNAYPLFGDEHVSTYQNKNLGIRFRGYIASEEVISADYVVGADCCHVLLVEGSTNLVISN